MKKRSSKPCALVVLAVLAAPVVGAREPRIVEAGSGRYEVLIDSPAGKGPFPLLVIAPAKKYAMGERIFERLAAGAAKLGYYVVRFDWGFYTGREEPSKDLSRETQDLAAVMDHFSGRPEIDRSRVVLAAKSFGGNVAMLGPHEKAGALLLITPNCDKQATFRKRHAPLFRGQKKTHIVISTADPYCQIGQIHEALKDLGPHVTIHTLGGDHNFALPGPASGMNEDAAIQGSLNWLSLLIADQNLGSSVP